MPVELRQHVLEAVKHRIERHRVGCELPAHKRRKFRGVAVAVPPEFPDLFEPLMQPPALLFAAPCDQLRFQLRS